MRKSALIYGCAVCFLGILTVVLWGVALREERGGLLEVSFLDVGQGDSIYIEAPSGRQVLIDGGKGSAVLRELSKKMPWWDRSIDLVIPTHPDGDHIGGLIEVLERYDVAAILRSSVEGDTKTFEVFNAAVDAERAEVTTAMRGQIVELGGGARLEILFPDRPVPHIETNDGSVVTRLVYGNTAFMLTGDAPLSIEKYLVDLDGFSLKSNVLKAGHHGSKTSSAPLFVGYVAPEYAIYSRGCNNSYGHPAEETVATFSKLGIPTLDTCEEGTITFVSDGQNVVKK